MADREAPPPMIVNLHEAPEKAGSGGGFSRAVSRLTPSMQTRGGKLNVNRMRLKQGQTAYPFHYHLLEDEVFVVLEGRGVLRYGEELRDIRSGDCISCPAGTRIAHQFANPYPEDFVYLAIGPQEPHDVCVYPDSDKIAVSGLDLTGHVTPKQYYEDEPNPPLIVALAAARR